MTIELDINDDGSATLSGNSDEMSKIYSEGIAYMLIKGLNNLNDKEVIEACRVYAELHLKNTPPIEDIADEWAYWSPGDMK